MFQKKQTTRIISLVSIGLVVVAVLFVTAMVLQSKAQEAEPKVNSEGPTVASAANPFNCKIDNISVFTDRIQVKCSSSTGGINIFATSAVPANEIYADRYYDLMQLAYSKARPLTIYYDENSGANPPGCQATDCRNITGLKLKP